MLTSIADSNKLPSKQKETAYEICKTLVEGPYSSALSGANTFDNIRWFNKEILEENLNLTILMMALAAKTTKVEEVFKLYKVLCSAKLKAAYKCELFAKAFAPVAKKKKAATKKTTTTKKKTTSKKKS